jgi:hypothetical protein
MFKAMAQVVELKPQYCQKKKKKRKEKEKEK